MNQRLFLRYFVAIITFFLVSAMQAQEETCWKLVGTKLHNMPSEEYKSMGVSGRENNVQINYSFDQNAIKIEKFIVGQYLSSYKDDPEKQKNATLAHDHYGESMTAKLIIKGLPDIIEGPTELKVELSIKTTCKHGDTFSTVPNVTVVDGNGEASVKGGAKVLPVSRKENTSSISVDEKSYATFTKSGDKQIWQIPFGMLNAKMGKKKVYRYIGIALSSSYGVAQSTTPIVYFVYELVRAKKVIKETEDFCWVFHSSAVYGAHEYERDDDGGVVTERRQYDKGVFRLEREYQHNGKTYNATAQGIAKGLKNIYHPGDEVAVGYELTSNPDDGPRENAIWARATIKYKSLGWNADNWERQGITNDTELPGALIDDDNYQIIVVPSGEKYNTVMKNNVVSPKEAGYTNDDEGDRKMYIILSCCNMDAVYCYHWASEKDAAIIEEAGGGATAITTGNSDSDDGGTSPAIPIIVGGLIGWAVVKIIRKGKKAKKTVVENVSGMKKRQGESEEEFVNRQIQEDLRQRGVKEYLKPQKGESYKSWRWRQDEFEKATKERDKKHQSYVREHTSMRDVTTPEEARKMMDDEMTNKLQPDQERNRRIERNWDIAYKTTYAAREGSKWALRTISSYSKATGGAHAASVADGGLALIAGAEELGNCINEGETVVKTIARTAIKGAAEYGKSKINSTGNYKDLKNIGGKTGLDTITNTTVDIIKGETSVKKSLIDTTKSFLQNGVDEKFSDIGSKSKSFWTHAGMQVGNIQVEF